MAASASKPVVLVIDDAPESIDVLRAMLAHDYQVKAAINGALGIELALATKPHIILLDVMMPGMDGYEVCRILKSNPETASVPIIFVTTLSDISSEARGLELGAVDYVTKPYVPGLVKSRVKTHVALQRQKLDLEELVTERTAEIVATRFEIIRRLGRAAEYRDNETGMHVVRMSYCSRLIALAHGLPALEADLLLHAAPMHDVGKIGIPDSILLKPGPLNAQEWEIMKRHTVIGAEIIGEHPSDLVSTARTIALRHHERWDGSGYPDGLVGEQIPLCARIVTLADVFDALLSIRPYKSAWTVESTLDHINKGSGYHFDPALVDAFFEVLPDCLAVRREYSDD